MQQLGRYAQPLGRFLERKKNVICGTHNLLGRRGMCQMMGAWHGCVVETATHSCFFSMSIGTSNAIFSEHLKSLRFHSHFDFPENA
jgi:hypothetical protein